MFLLINLKAYDCDAGDIADAARAVAEAYDTRIGVAPQMALVSTVARSGVETWAQHVDPVPHGSHTGRVHAASLAEVGAAGTLLNHSERRLRLAAIDRGIERAHEAGLETVVCANTPKQVRAVSALGPDAVAIEPPELIGTGTPVSKADPDVVSDAIEAAASVDDSVRVLCGAGISTGDDVRAALELGAAGVLLASGVAKATDPTAAIESLVTGAQP